MEIVQALKVGTKGAIKLVVVFLVLDQSRSTEQVKIVQIGVYQLAFQAHQQVQQFADGDRDFVLTQGKEEVNEHVLASTVTTVHKC